MMAPDISFIIPVRNDEARLRRCLESIRTDAESVAAEIIVADNGSTDGSAEAARQAGATVVSLPDRPVADVRNAAVGLSGGALIAFVDADHEIAPGWTRQAIALLRDPAVCGVGADYHAPPQGTWVQRMYDNFRTRAPHVTRVDWLPSGNLVVRRSAFDGVGGFDTRLESCEDVDFCRRLREAGGHLLALDSLRSVHHGDPRSLRALFFAELWRGRDNLRVTLRDRLTPRAAAGICLTIAYLLALGATAVGLLAWPLGGGIIVAAGLATVALLTLLRAGRLLSRMPSSDRNGRHVLEAILVAVTYDTARALALVARVGHDVRRKAGR